MEQHLRKILAFLLIPLIVISWQLMATAEVAVESPTSYAVTPDDSQLETNITRAEASKMFAMALKLPIPATETVYNDVRATHWAKDYIAAASKAGLFDGYPDGTFKPEETLTHEELAQILIMALELQKNEDNQFAEVTAVRE
ncbi:S-layer homology domain-containing protein [Planococcus shenhongbingii]|uniref:S-layer homology domain-containing protein n=1 Tax=Planococcus shenhongbingii TaxID=3058398 RepID=UPI0026121603|nr:S-layer homology domain-containing protein [Planococcus sp. N016]WKA57765.1 S-layer homology domain-containing protein [Planococcus sp. N016]